MASLISWEDYYNKHIKEKGFDEIVTERIKICTDNINKNRLVKVDLDNTAKILVEKVKENAYQYNSYVDELDKLKEQKIDINRNTYINPVKNAKGLNIFEGDNIINTDQFKKIVELDDDGKFKLSFNTIEGLLTSYNAFSNELNRKEPIDEYMNINNTSKLVIKFKILTKPTDFLNINGLIHFIKDDICKILKEEYKVIVDINKIDVLKQNDIYIISISDHNVITKIDNIYHFAKKMLENDNYNKRIEIIDPIIKDNKYINNIDVKSLESISNPGEDVVNMILKTLFSSETLKLLNKNVVINVNIETLINNSFNNNNDTNIEATTGKDINIVKGNKNNIKGKKKENPYDKFIEFIKTKNEYNEDSIDKHKLFKKYKKFMLKTYEKKIEDGSLGSFMRVMKNRKLIESDKGKDLCIFIK
jgi:hypothetical protein